MSITSMADVERVLAEDDALYRDEHCPVAKRQRELAAQAHQKSEPVSRAWNAQLDRLERQLAAVAQRGEQRVAILRDALADFIGAELAKRDDEIVGLKEQLTDLRQKLEQQAAVDQRVNEISARLEEKQPRRDSGKNGITDGEFLQAMGTLIAQERHSARTELKAAIDGAQSAFEAKLAAVEERIKGIPGRLPVAKIWCAESVTYLGEFVSHEGGLYQAKRDTAQAPGGTDWACVARAGRDGVDGVTPNIRGKYDTNETYKKFDAVSYDGSTFIAQRDDPGIPGNDDDWQLLAARGAKGAQGPRGEPGNRGVQGEPGSSIHGWLVDPVNYRVSVRLSNGEIGPMLELRPLFEQFFAEAVQSNLPKENG